MEGKKKKFISFLLYKKQIYKKCVKAERKKKRVEVTYEQALN